MLQDVVSDPIIPVDQEALDTLLNELD